MKQIFCLVLALASSVLGANEISGSDSIRRLIAEIRDCGGSVGACFTRESGVVLVGIGRSTYKRGAINKCREVARLDAVKNVTSALAQAVKAKDAVALNMSVDSEGNAEVSAFVSSLTETSVDQLVKGLQVVSSGKNADGEMEVVVYLAAKMQDAGSELLAVQAALGDKGVVKATGIDTDRTVAEKNALRSAVEQVAGTLVVGKVSVNEKEELHKRLATTAGALVEEYRVVSETKVELGFRIEVLAKVSKRKLYENYRSYFKCLDNPAFCFRATDPALVENFKQFFTDKGLTLVNNPEEANYFIDLKGRFRERPTPGLSSSMGTMLDLGIEIVSVDGSKTLLAMSDRQAKDSEVLTAEQRRYEVSRRIFTKLEKRLHKAIQDMVVRMLDDKDTQDEVSLSTGMSF